VKVVPNQHRLSRASWTISVWRRPSNGRRRSFRTDRHPLPARSFPEDLDLDERHSSAIFRIFQELLTNITRHARASKVGISEEEERILILEVQDSSRGITRSLKADSDSVNWERVALLGSRFSIG
jgi:signal transduction histidine kinase